jgi:hypothetical protein
MGDPLDMVTLFGDSITVTNPPAIPPMLTSLIEHFLFQVTGSVGSNYVVQASTNLMNPNWVSLIPMLHRSTSQNQMCSRCHKVYRGMVAP